MDLKRWNSLSYRNNDMLHSLACMHTCVPLRCHVTFLYLLYVTYSALFSLLRLLRVQDFKLKSHAFRPRVSQFLSCIRRRLVRVLTRLTFLCLQRSGRRVFMAIHSVISGRRFNPVVLRWLQRSHIREKIKHRTHWHWQNHFWDLEWRYQQL